MKNRQQVIDSIKAHPEVSVLIIGAGVNGIGTFRDLSLQGVDCLIVDRGDFCSGASMASSHMLHGGIRYLENGEFRLVREALHERNNLLRNAPHLTGPLPTTIPIFKWLSGILNAPLKFLGLLDKPAERGALIIKMGLLMYDFYVRGDSPMPNHHFDNRAQALERWPALNPDIIFAATYYDGCMKSPERLALDILKDGLAEGDHARAANYLEAVGSDGKNVILQDLITGEKLSVLPQIVINAGGPWIDFINQDISRGSDFIGGTKGSHLIVDHPELRQAIGDHEFFFEYLDGRIVLIFPYLDDHVMIGSTDLRTDDPDQAVCTPEEIDYILGMVPRIFPGLSVTREQIIFQFSGVRPLPVASGSTGQISRDHSIEVLDPGSANPWPILSLVGGKWTSYRAFSEQVADRVLDYLDRTRLASTDHLPIGGGKGYPGDEAGKQSFLQELVQTSGLDRARVEQLFERYGTRAEQICPALAGAEGPSLARLPGYSKAELSYLVDQEMVTRLEDLLLRRTKLAWGGELTAESLTEAGNIVGDQLGWSAEDRKREISRTADLLREKHGLKL